MRTAKLTALVWLIGVCSAQALPAPAASLEEAAEQPQAKYLIECRVLAKPGDKDAVSSRRVLLTEGQEAKISDQVERPYVTAVKKIGDRDTPHVQAIREGTTLDVCVYADVDGKVTLDATLEHTVLTGVDMIHGRQSPRLRYNKIRVIECTELDATVVALPGEPGKTPRIEFTVSKAK